MTPLFPVAGPALVIGMLHLPPLPGTPFHEPGSLPAVVDRARRGARALRDGGADGALLQTVDRVYSVHDEAEPARIAAMTLVARAVLDEVGDDLAVGVQLMRNAVSASLAVATVVGARFVRATALVGATLSPHGIVQPDPLAIARNRVEAGAQDVALVADVASMHYRWLDGARAPHEVARAAHGVGADAVAVSGPDDEILGTVAGIRRHAPDVPVVLAGGTHPGNAARLLPEVDAAFVGSCLERDGWGGEIDEGRVARYVDAARGAGGGR